MKTTTQKLLHKYKLWCPKCYEDWRSQEKEIYEPLIWKLKPVTVCSTHHLSLQEFCPHCLKNNYHLAWKTRPGYCSKCDLWLGQLKADNQSLLVNEKKQTLDWHLWVSKNLEELLANNSSYDVTWSRNTVSQSLMKYAQQKAEGKYPSQNKVEKLISRPGLLRYKEVKQAFAKAKQELNFR